MIHFIAEVELPVIVLQSEFLTKNRRRLTVFCFAFDGEDTVLDTDLDPVFVHCRQVCDHNQRFFVFENVHRRCYVDSVIPRCQRSCP